MVSRIKILKKLSLPALFLLALTACSGDGPSGPDEAPADADALLVDVSPTGGSTGVGLDESVMLEFDHAMDPSMSSYADVHEGDISGVEVPGTWGWLEGHTVLRFTPSGGFEPATRYVVHVGGGMTDADGHMVDLESHGDEMGGEWATDPMMGGENGGHMDPGDHMGEAWDHPSNGSHGMIFTFTTTG